MDKIDGIFECLVDLDEKRWDWHVNLPNFERIKKREIISFLFYLYETNCAKFPETIVEEDSEDGVESAYEPDDIEKLVYLAWKLNVDSEERGKCIRAIRHFQEYFYYAKKPELQEKLALLRKRLEEID